MADVFPKLRTPRSVDREMSKKFCLRGPLDKQHGKRAQTLLESEGQRLHQFLDYCKDN